MDTSKLLKKEVIIPVGVGVASLTTGFFAGYIYGKRKAIVEVLEAMNISPKEDAPQMSLFDETFNDLREEVIEIDVDAIEMNNAIEIAKQNHPSAHQPDSDTSDERPSREWGPATFEAPQRVNIFEGVDGDWDYEAEMANRGPRDPYIIHYDEFINNESDFAQETLTYYAGDDIMADQEDTPLYGFSDLMGELKFGHGSNDPNVVYIRNPGIRMEWEILLHIGKFEQEVLGLQIEEEYESEDLKHSMNHKFREE